MSAADADCATGVAPRATRAFHAVNEATAPASRIPTLLLLLLLHPVTPAPVGL